MAECLSWHKPVLAELAARHQAGRMPHAMLLTAGSDPEAMALASTLPYFILCDTHNACGDCRACRLLEQGAHSDHHLCQPEGTSKVIKIDQVRALVNIGAKTANYPAGKVLLLAPAGALNRNAANALLKFLEEPPANTYLVLVAAQTSQIPATVISRCQKLVVARPDRQQANDFLASRGLSAARADTLLALSSNEPLLAMDIEESGSADGLLRLLATVEEWLADAAVARSLGQSAQGLEGNMLLRVLIANAHQSAMFGALENDVSRRVLVWHKALVDLHGMYLRSPNINLPLALEQVCVNIR